MKTNTFAGILLLGAVGGCMTGGEVKDPADIPEGEPTGTLIVTLSDEDGGQVSGAVEGVFLRLEDVRVKHESRGWISLLDERKDIDLMSLRGGAPLEIARGVVYDGSYDTLRMIIPDAWIVVDGAEQELTIDEGLGLPMEGIDFRETFFVGTDGQTTLNLNWDLDTQLMDDDGDWKLGTGALIAVEVGGD